VSDPAIAQPVFGRLLTAMVTPFRADGSLDLEGAAALAEHLVEAGNDGLVLNGTTGESPTTSDDEKSALVRAVNDAVGDRAHVVAGVGTHDTEHSIHLAEQALKAGATGLLAVTPYYNKPPQSGLVAHFTAIADATDLPVMLYDIPKRTACEIESETLLRLSEHPRIVANKDAKGDLPGSSYVMANCDLTYYSGDDVMTVPLMSVGAVGVVSVIGHAATPRMRALVDAAAAGDFASALDIHRELLPVFTGMFRTQGVILAKAALTHLDLPGGPVRLPLVDATPDQVLQLVRDLAAGRVPGFIA
jgi:4-hydroxy-tetrahydrodipicolinate synthase